MNKLETKIRKLMTYKEKIVAIETEIAEATKDKVAELEKFETKYKNLAKIVQAEMIETNTEAGACRTEFFVAEYKLRKASKITIDLEKLQEIKPALLSKYAKFDESSFKKTKDPEEKLILKEVLVKESKTPTFKFEMTPINKSEWD